MSAAKQHKADQSESIEWLKARIPVGSTVYGTVRHVSRSGMMRHISFFVVDAGEILPISWHLSRALGYRLASENRHALKVGGCGMDMIFSVISNLSYALHGIKHDAPMIGADGKAHRPGYTLMHRDL